MTLATFLQVSRGFVTCCTIGHALGLKHPHDDGGNGRPTFASLGISQYDNIEFTLMSYRDSLGVMASTPMLFDILAVQRIYGANTSYHTGNDTYEVATYHNTIWDAGGVDTLDASKATDAVRIDLRPGDSSRLIYGFTTIAYDVAIENAIGSRHDDTIIGNDADNVLDGGDSQDTMSGGKGNDTYFIDNNSLSTEWTS